MTSPDSATHKADTAQQALFNAAYDAHRQSLHAYLFGRTGDRELTHELLQETFMRAWRHVHVLQGMVESQHRYWLFSIAQNLLTDHYRKQATRAAIDRQLQNDVHVASAAARTPHEEMAEQEQMQQLDRAIARLPEDLRTVLLMQVLGEMNSTQISELLDRPAGTVRYQISAARKRLAEEMKLLE
ncbi:MAG: RNA polymerase sigma factor [Caldilineaceae bacterium]